MHRPAEAGLCASFRELATMGSSSALPRRLPGLPRRFCCGDGVAGLPMAPRVAGYCTEQRDKLCRIEHQDDHEFCHPVGLRMTLIF